ncbi:MAG: hypothetical protein HY096_00460 [Nitrospinae bacterium]|nr:hypothetical protein [Nitrospinota bacterium]
MKTIEVKTEREKELELLNGINEIFAIYKKYSLNVEDISELDREDIQK